ncbi:MAG TPA: hypothetical protein VFU47_06320, partial [Armatimonadota bacterium]|nr:hypothetical protein [Armatimonadota bacterium]
MKGLREPRTTVFDPDQAGEQWLRILPGSVRAGVVEGAELAHVMRLAEQFLRTGSPEALAELDTEVYRLGFLLEPRIGHEGTLRYLRDCMARVLTRSLPEPGRCAEGLTCLVARVSDGVWSAHTNRLQQTIHRQQGERLRQELTVAKRIQERLLPRTIPAVPGYDIAGRVLPAEEVGGDYWSCKSYPEDDLVTFKLADVTGHGIAAATLVSAVKFISGGYYRGAKSAAQVMERTNHVLVKETP